MRKIVVAVTGASGSIYARLLLEKLAVLRGQWEAVAVVMSDNAKEVWQTELGNTAWSNHGFPFFFRQRILWRPLPRARGNTIR